MCNPETNICREPSTTNFSLILPILVVHGTDDIWVCLYVHIYVRSNFTVNAYHHLCWHDTSLPTIVTDSGADAKFAFREFFNAEIADEHTRRAYCKAVWLLVFVIEPRNLMNRCHISLVVDVS